MGYDGFDLVPIVVICGPTAVGKSEVAIALAERLDGEIVCADSRTLYRGMDIGAAKPPASARGRVRHHLLDVADPASVFTVADFQRLAAAAIADIRARGRLPLLVGGTGLYIRAVIDGMRLPPVPPDWPLRAALEAQESRAPGALHARLARLDPATAARIHPANVRRVVRALEVVVHTGAPMSALRGPGAGERALWFGLTMDRDELNQRIAARAAANVAAGLVTEVRVLLDAGVSPRAPAMQGLGYKEMIEVALGRASVDEALTLLVRNTRRYAKRQWTWFRAERRLTWIDASGRDPADVAASIAAGIASGSHFAR